jgi:hypothetical protein
MNSLRSAWTPLLAGPADPHLQAKGETEARSSLSCVEIYSLSDWYKIPVRSFRCARPVPGLQINKLAAALGGENYAPIRSSGLKQRDA